MTVLVLERTLDDREAVLLGRQRDRTRQLSLRPLKFLKLILDLLIQLGIFNCQTGLSAIAGANAMIARTALTKLTRITSTPPALAASSMMIRTMLMAQMRDATSLYTPSTVLLLSKSALQFTFS